MSVTTATPGIFSISGRLWLILLMVQLANMLFGMTITIANVVLPQIRGSMSASQDEISWAITLNLVATAVATPMPGWLAGRVGWRALMFGTVLGFTVSSFLCGIAAQLRGPRPGTCRKGGGARRRIAVLSFPSPPQGELLKSIPLPSSPLL